MINGHGGSGAHGDKVTPWMRSLPEHLQLPVEGGFTPWERWAWSQIALGEMADMAFVPLAHRGTAEDRAPFLAEGAPDDGGDAETVGERNPSPFKLYKNEGAGSFNLTRFGADAPTGFQQGDPIPRDDGPAFRSWQTLSERFFLTILFTEPYASARAKPFVKIQHARVPDRLDFENRSFDGALGLYRSLFEGELEWIGLSVDRLINLHGSVFLKKLSADRLHTGGAVFLHNTAIFMEGVRLAGATIGGAVSCIGATFRGPLEASGLKAGGDLFLRGGAEFEREVMLLGAQAGGVLDCMASNFYGRFVADRLKTGGSLFLNKGAKFFDEVKFLGGEVDGSIVAIGGQFNGPFKADGVKTTGDLFFRCDNSDEPTVFASSVDLVGAKIGGDLQLPAGAFGGQIDLTGAIIGGELQLSQPQLGNKPKWGENAKLNLRNVRAKVLQATLDSWKLDNGAFVDVDLTGFNFEKLGGGLSNEGGMQLAPARQLAGWIRATQKKDGFSPAPYQALARTLRDRGEVQKARDILFFMRKAETKTRKGLSRLAASAQGLFTGYGYRPAPVFLFMGLLIMASALMGVVYEGVYLDPIAFAADPASLHALFGRFADWFGYSLETAIPIVQLDTVDDEFLLTRTGLIGEYMREESLLNVADNEHLEFLRRWFVAHKVIGLVLVAYMATLIAAPKE